MPYAPWRQYITDAAGNIITNAQVRVRQERQGLPPAQIYADSELTQTKTNPFQATDGLAEIYARGGFYRVDIVAPGLSMPPLRFVAIGNAQAVDTDQIGIGSNTDKQVANLTARAVYDDEEEDFSVLISDIGDGRAGISSKLSGDTADWSEIAIITGKTGTGTGLSFDVTVADLTERALYDDEAEGYRALVSNAGNGRSAVYVKLSGDSADWSDPNYLDGGLFDLTIQVNDFPYSGEQVLNHIFREPINFEAGFTGSVGKAEGFSTGEAIFLFYKNGVEIGSVTFDNSVDPTFSLPGGASFDTGDIAKLIAPSPQDATLFNVTITLAGKRLPAS